jgi:microcystin-dependent protein
MFVSNNINNHLKANIMKKVYTILLFLCISSITFAQGIAVQGIARDNANSAITDTNLTFTFTISKNDNVALYTETQPIKTDNFGVFSHIVSGGTPVTGTFNTVDFSITDLKIKISVNYLGNTLEVYNQTFQYTPYAHFAKKAAFATNATNAANADSAVKADNGVPTGSIMPYIGTTAPQGWVLCNGQSLAPISGSGALRSLVGSNAPDLQGIFLRGTGVSFFNGQSGPALRDFQNDTFESHNHDSGTLATVAGGAHTHTYVSGAGSRNGIDSSGFNEGEIGIRLTDNTTTSSGNHTHTVNGEVSFTGDNETRPVNYGVNYIIKL